MQEVDPSSDAAAISHLMMVRPFTRYVAYVEAQPVATQRRGAISNMLLFTTHMAGQPPSHDAIDNNRCKKRFLILVAIETAGTLNQMAVELVQEIGRRITLVTEDSRETVFLSQRLSIALQRGNAVSFLSTFTATD